MALGDVIINNFTVGSLNFNDPRQIMLSGFKVHETIMSATGPTADARVIDFQDAIGKSRFDGTQDVNISFTYADEGQTASFKLTSYQNTNIRDHSEAGDYVAGSGGAMHHKQADARFVAPEHIAVTGNPISKSYYTNCEQIITDVLQNYFRTNKSILTPSPTEGPKRLIANQEPPLSFVDKVKDESVSSTDESSLYFLYATRMGGSEAYVYETIESMCRRSSGVVLTQRTTLATAGSTDSEKRNQIISFTPSRAFYKPPRANLKMVPKTYNMATGILTLGRLNSAEPGLLGAPVGDANKENIEIPYYTNNDPSNNLQKNRVGDARANRGRYIAAFMENVSYATVVGNPSIKVGHTVYLNIPKKVSDPGGFEPQLNGAFLVSGITHIIRPITATPRYTMELELIKGAFNS